MKGNLIYDIECFMKRHKFEKVCVFINNTYDIKSISTAFGLCEFLRSIGIDSDVIVKNPARMKDFYSGTKKEEDRKFMAVAIGCKYQNDIESNEYFKTYVLFNVYGPLKTKGYGVLNYTDQDVSCTAEIVFNHINEYAKETGCEIPQKVAQHLYTALIAGTKRYGSNIKSNTFTVAQELVNHGANYKWANYLCEKKNPIVLEVQNILFKHLVRQDRIVYAIVPEKELTNDISLEDIADTLQTFKKVDKVEFWIVFIEKDDGYYNVIIQSKDINPYSAFAVAIKNNGIGTEKTARCCILKQDVNKLLNEVNEEMRKKDTELAGRKITMEAYTRRKLDEYEDD